MPLAQVRDSVVGRGRRGIAYLEAKLAGEPVSLATAADVHLQKAAKIPADHRAGDPQ